jgi:hypothetical protein
VTIGSLPLEPAAGRRAFAPVERLPALFATAPLDPATALGRLFAADWSDTSDEATAELLGSWRPTLALLPERERRRAALFALWARTLSVTAGEGDRVERRLERLNRSAFLLAKALAGEATASPFAARFAAESAARHFPRRALDLLLAEARAKIAQPRPVDLEDWRARARALGGACAEALLGQKPSGATVDAATALLRLALLVRLPAALANRRSHLPVLAVETAASGGAGDSDPDEATAELLAAEVGEVRAQLLRGARALAEVPLGYRRALAYLSAAALDLVGRVEEHPAMLLRSAPKVGWWRRSLIEWRERRTPI